MVRRADSQTIDLFALERGADTGSALDWPDAARFPLNANGRHVSDHAERVAERGQTHF